MYAAAAIVAAETEGSPVCWRDLDYMAGLVVNDSVGPAEIIREHGEPYGFDPAGYDLGD